MRFLLDDRFAPITSTMGFVEADVETAARSEVEWWNNILIEIHTARHWEAEPVTGDLESVLRRLPPLTAPLDCRRLFVPTQSPWTAFFSNFRLGSAGSMYLMAQRLRCRGMRVTAAPHTMPAHVKRDTKGQWGATIWELYGPDPKVTRVVSAVNDGGPWTFDQYGEPLDFEDTSAYAAKRVRDRFTPEMLDSYLRHFGIRVFDDAFYVPHERPAIFLHEVGKGVKRLEFPLLHDDAG